MLPALLLAAWPALAEGAGKLRVEVGKVPRSTAVTARLEGEIGAPAAAVQAVLCDLEGYPTFSKTTERVAILGDDEARELQRSPPDGRSAVEPLLRPGRHRAACPGRTYVLNLLDFPFPLRDGWAMAVYDAAVSGATFQIRYDMLVGSAKGSGEYAVTPIAPGQSRLVVTYRMDLGFSLPGFIIDWVLHTEMPHMFEAIERDARRRAPN
jgi:hypothetical protein